MTELDKLKAIELDILDKFAQVCNCANLLWYAMFGTLLGATRHGGFIPWDDDIDVAMLRADYDRLRKQPELFEYPYFLQTTQNDPAAAPKFMRQRRSDTAVMTDFPDVFTRGGNMGAYIDIIPLDDVPNIYAAGNLSAAAMRMQQQLHACAALDENDDGKVPVWKARICYSNGGLPGSYALVAEHYEMVLSEYAGINELTGKQSQYCAMPALGGVRGCYIFDKEWFAARETMLFEGMEIYAPKGWRELLVACYPEGLLEPDEEHRKPKHEGDDVIIDTERSYTEYVKRYSDMLVDITGKDILIFGAGDSLRIWLERYANGDASGNNDINSDINSYIKNETTKEINVVAAFDNSESKWGTTAYGIPIYPPTALPAMMSSDTRLIIASIYHKEIGEQLQNMGINDYFVFIDGWNYNKVT